jgi:hypothetical protein
MSAALLRELAETRERAATSEERATLLELELRKLRIAHEAVLERALAMAFRLEDAERAMGGGNSEGAPSHVDD